MIDKKGQSALEYLMTYGWALVVIVIVIAALVVLLGPQGASDTCTPSAKFPVLSQVDSGGNLVLVVTNSTAQTITVTDFNATVSAAGVLATNVPDPWAAGKQVNNITFTGILTKGTKYNVPIAITYTDQYGSKRIDSVTCTGTAD